MEIERPFNRYTETRGKAKCCPRIKISRTRNSGIRDRSIVSNQKIHFNRFFMPCPAEQEMQILFRKLLVPALCHFSFPAWKDEDYLVVDLTFVWTGCYVNEIILLNYLGCTSTLFSANQTIQFPVTRWHIVTENWKYSDNKNKRARIFRKNKT